mgnify:CR=1 FL=1
MCIRDSSYRERRMVDLGLETVRAKVDFVQGDACNLKPIHACLLYTSDAADERSSVDLGGRRIIKKKNKA